MNLIDFQISEMQKILLLICESRAYYDDMKKGTTLKTLFSALDNDKGDKKELS